MMFRTSLIAVVVLAAGSARAADPPTSGVPVGPAGSPAPAGAPAIAPGAEDKGSDVRRGLVAVEQGGRVAGVGVVLGTDGRILTSLSAVAGEDVTVKLPDGRTVRARVGHRDKSLDLALLVLQTGKWTEGLRASEVDPSSVSLRAVASTAGGKATTVAVTLKGKTEAKSKDGLTALAGALDVELPKGATPLAGAPLLDDKGSVLGVYVKACRPPAPAPAAGTMMLAPTKADAGAKPQACTASWVGAPVSWIRSFLSKTPLEAVAPSPWLGIAGETGTSGATSGVRVLAVAPASPAEKGGIKGNSDRAKAHLIVAVDGVPVATPEKLAEAIAKRGVGDSVKVLILDGDKLKELAVTLKAAPQ